MAAIIIIIIIIIIILLIRHDTDKVKQKRRTNRPSMALRPAVARKYRIKNKN